MAAFPIFDACTYFGPWPERADLTLESLQAVMATSNIARSLTLSSLGIFHDFRTGNAATLEASRSNSALIPVGTLDPRAYPAAIAEADKCAANGFRLFRFFPDRQNYPIRYLPFRELIQKCDQLGIAVAVSVSRPGDLTELADSTAFVQVPILLSGVTSDNLGEAIAVLKTSPKFHIETTYLAAPGALEAVVNAVPSGGDRLVFASNSPLRYLSAALGPVMASSLNADQKAAIFGGNLKRLVSK